MERLIINTLIILFSTTRIFLFAIEQEPLLKELYTTGYFNHTITLLGISSMLYFAIKFAERAIADAKEDSRIKAIQNHELIASEEEIRASLEELKATTDTLSETNEELSIAKTKAEESDRLKTVFLSNMSHEVRTPLNGIVGFANLLKTKEHTDTQDKYYTDIISKSGEQLLKIIDDLIEISQLETEQFKIHQRTVDVKKLLNELIQDFNPIVTKKGVKLVIDEVCRFSRLKELKTDRSKLYNILKQLIDNALKFTPKGFVKIKYYRENEFVVFEVKDTGIGFEQKRTSDIFLRFVQADEKIAIDFGGLGLGLAIAKLNVESLGGQIFAESETGKGSTFHFKIPDKSIRN